MKRKELHNNIARYVEKVGIDKAESVAVEAIKQSLYDMAHMIVGIDNLYMAMVTFQVEVLKYLRCDPERVDELCILFSKEASE